MISFDFSYLDIKPGHKILDIGCGSGRHTAAIYDVGDVIVSGSDLCFEDLKLADRRMNFHDQLSEHGCGHWDLSVADISCLPYRDAYFDFIVCSEVLEHVHDHENAIKELVRVLKPGKTLVVSVPRYFPEKIYWILSDDYTNTDQKHVRIYRKNNLIRLLETFGLSCRCYHYSHSLHTPFWFLKCIIGPMVTDSLLVNLYHDFLVWDLMKKPRITRLLDKIFNPIFGKSLVLYSAKDI